MSLKRKDSNQDEMTGVKRSKQTVDAFDEALSLLEGPAPEVTRDAFDEALNLLEESHVILLVKIR